MISKKPERKIISNSSPLIALQNIGMFNLLEMLYSQIIVPPGVHEEVFGVNGEEAPDG